MHVSPKLFRAALALALPAVAGAAPVSTASAGSFACSASALQLSVLGSGKLEPTTANQGQAGCNNAYATLPDAASALSNPALAALAPVSASAVAAYTSFDRAGGDEARQGVLAGGGVAGLTIRALPDLPLTVDQITAPATDVSAIQIPYSNAALQTVLGLLGQPTTITADATKAVQSLVPAARALTATDLVGVRTAMAYAGGGCQAGRTVLRSDADVAGLTIAGQEAPTDQVVTKAITLLPPASVDFGKVAQLVAADSTLVSLSSNVTDVLTATTGDLPLLQQALLAPAQDALNSIIAAAVAPGGVVYDTLSALPTVSVPEVAANIVLAPGKTARTADSVTQQALALRATITAAGRTIPLVEGVIGQASAGASDLACAATAPGEPVSPADPSTPTGAALQCTKRRLVLVDVLERRDGVKLTGVADPRYIGRKVAIVFEATGRVVARAKVRRDGSFATRAGLPRRGLRASNRARYVARLGSQKSLNLKLRRRLVVRRMVSRNGRVTISGRVVRPLATPVAPILVRQRVSCRRMKVVKRFRPQPDGRFSVTLRAPRQGGSAVYRLTTRVRDSARGRKLFETFTLPRAVEIKR